MAFKGRGVFQSRPFKIKDFREISTETSIIYDLMHSTPMKDLLARFSIEYRQSFEVEV